MPPIPADVLALLDALWHAGFSAYVVGGSLRDAFLGRPAADWDLTTNARPEAIQAVFPGSIYENRFGTVLVNRDGVDYEITTFRLEHEYADHRRPHRLEFGDRIEDDLARRDFTINALAFGAELAAAGRPSLVDPFGGRRDIDARVLRAVGRAEERFEEDALRMIRAVRLATTLEFEIEPVTLAAIASHASLASYLSGERIGAEIAKLLAAPRPSVGLRIMAETGLLAEIAPELAGQRGVAQNKIEGEDLWDHTLRSVDAAPADRPIVRLASLLHDVGKPATAGEGHFHGHDVVGAGMAEALLRRWRMPRSVGERIGHLVRNHMFSYESNWSDAAVRRFIGKIGELEVEELFALRAADNVGSGLPAETPDLVELRRRVDEQLEAHVALDRGDLAIDGDDLQRELGLQPSPTIGRILDSLVDEVIADPALNDRPTLLALAQRMVADER